MQTPALSPPLLLRTLIVAGAIILVGGYVLGHYRVLDETLPQATAQRFLVKEDGNLYSISDALGERKIIGNGNIKFLFDEKPGKLLIGEGWETDGPYALHSGGTKLFVMNEDGSGKKQLISDRVLRGKFDKNGENIFFNTEKLDLFRAAPDGSEVEKVQSKADSFDISPDGRYVVYQKQHPDWQLNEYYENQLGIAVLDLETNQETLISNDADDFNPLWTPDQKKILFFSASPEGLVSHFIMNADGSNRKQLTNHGQVYVTAKTVPIPSEMPIWSADGRFLIYESDRAIWINQFDKNTENIVKSWSVGYGKEPKWLKDGMSLSILNGTNGKSGLLKLDMNGTLLK